jgi:hypothetical protein
MQKVRLIIVFLLIALFVTVGVVAAQPSNFRAHLVGGEENPPVDTTATGQAVFQLDASGSSLHYMLIVANIEDVFASHIHCGPVGVNGPVGVTLFGGSTVTVNGILAEATVTAPNPGNACGWADLADVVEAMESGDTYVNVHTTDNPGGEIRGQIH